MSLRMSPEELAQYREEGFIVRRGVFAPDEMAAIAGHSEALIQDLLKLRREEKFEMGSYLFERQWDLEVNVKWEPDAPELVQGVEPCAHLSPGLKALGEDPRLLEPAKDAVGAE